MSFYLSPLVDIKEVDISTTIPAVASSVGVIILRQTYKGPEMVQSFITNRDELIARFGEPTSDADCYQDMLSAEAFLKYGSALYATRVMPTDALFASRSLSADGTWTTSNSASNLTLANLNEEPTQFADITPTGDLDVMAISRGAWGNNIRIATLDYTTQSSYLEGGTISSNASAAFTTVDSRLEDTKNFLIVVEAKSQNSGVWEVVETFNVSTDPLATDDQGGSKFVENVVNQQSQYIVVSLKSSKESADWTLTSNWGVLASGTDGTGNAPDSAIQDALDLYRNPEVTDVNLFIDSNKSETIKKYMITICEERKDCMAILDCPQSIVVNNRGNESTNLRDWRKGVGSFTVNNLNVNTSYAAVYGNWLEVYNRYLNKYNWVPASGYVAGIYAKTDDVTDPWFAPAGLNRAIITGIRRLAWNPTKGSRDLLYSNGINPVVSFAGQGKVIWGQKNLLDKSSAFNRVNVRRLFMVLEKAVATASKYFLFEPNDAATRRQLKNMIEPFLRDVQSRRGIYEYKVICDTTNNTPERIDRNELWCSILIKPTRTAEFIVLQFVATKTDANFDEIAGQI